MDQAIEVAGLTKTYAADRGSFPLRAVDGIDFTVRAGEVFGFLGPNGAGKTSTIRMLPVSAGRLPGAPPGIFGATAAGAGASASAAGREAAQRPGLRA